MIRGPFAKKYVAHDKAWIAAIVFICAVASGLYMTTLWGDFVYDDKQQVLKNLWIRDIRFIPQIFMSDAWRFAGKFASSNYYRPMMHMSYLVDYYIFGLKPWGFHLINILLHTANSALVFMTAGRLFRNFHSPAIHTKVEEGKSGVGLHSGPSVFPPFIVALLFAAHPVHTEAVAWIAAFPELSYSFFFLLALYLYIRSLDGEKWVYILSVMAFFAATLCKEPALVLPLVLMAYDLISNRGVSSALSFREVRAKMRLVRYLPYIVASAIYLLLRAHAMGGFMSMNGSNTLLSASGYIVNIFPLFFEYLGKLLLPINLNAFHVFYPIGSILGPKGLISLAAAMLFVLAVFFSFKRNGPVFFGLVLIVLPLLPCLYIPALGMNVFAERYLYLPSFGFALIAGQAFAWLEMRGWGRPAVGAAMIIALLYSVGTVARNSIWEDEMTLFSDTARKSPEAAIPHNNLGMEYIRANLFDDAEKELLSAIRLMPDYVDAHNNLGIVYFEQGRLDEAIAEYEAALNFDPGKEDALYNLANAHAKKGLLSQAILEYKTLIGMDPGYAEAHNNLAIAYAMEDRLEEAAVEFTEAVRLSPDREDWRRNLFNCEENIRAAKK